MNDEKMMTEAELAARWNVSKRTLQAWRLQNRGPAWVKLGSCARAPVRYVKSDVEDYEQRQNLK